MKQIQSSRWIAAGILIFMTVGMWYAASQQREMPCSSEDAIAEVRQACEKLNGMQVAAMYYDGVQEKSDGTVIREESNVWSDYRTGEWYSKSSVDGKVVLEKYCDGEKHYEKEGTDWMPGEENSRIESLDIFLRILEKPEQIVFVTRAEEENEIVIRAEWSKAGREALFSSKLESVAVTYTIDSEGVFANKTEELKFGGSGTEDAYYESMNQKIGVTTYDADTVNNKLEEVRVEIGID